MKNMRPQSNSIKQLPPVIASFGRDLATDFRSARLEIAKEWDDRLWYGNGEGHVGSSFGSGEGDSAAYQIHPLQRDSSFAQAAASGQSDLKAYSHPIRDDFMAQGISHGRDLGRAKGGEDADAGGWLNGVVVKGNSLALTQQATLAVDPLEKLNISQGAVTVDAVAGAVAVSVGGPSIGTTPSDVELGLAGAEVLQVDLVLRHKHLEPVPAIAVVGRGERAGRPVMDMVQNPIVPTESALLFGYGYFSRLSQCLRSVQLGVNAVLGWLAHPLSARSFVSDRVALTSFSRINTSHVASVAYASHP